MNRTNIDNTP